MANQWILFRHYIIIWETNSPNKEKSQMNWTTDWLIGSNRIESYELALVRVCESQSQPLPRCAEIIWCFPAFSTATIVIILNPFGTGTCKKTTIHAYTQTSARVTCTVVLECCCNGEWLYTAPQQLTACSPTMTVHTRFNTLTPNPNGMKWNLAGTADAANFYHTQTGD